VGERVNERVHERTEQEGKVTMCGRYQLASDPRPLVEALGADDPGGVLDGFESRWNIAPSEPPRAPDSRARTPRRLTRVPIVRLRDEEDEAETGELVMDEVLWPLVPGWAKGEVPKYSTANARSETMAEKPSFRAAWRAGRRCLVLASGFYEWQAAGGDAVDGDAPGDAAGRAGDRGRGRQSRAPRGKGPKQPWLLTPANERWFCFGGLWERSWSGDGTAVRSCTIVTMAANPLMREIHNAGKNRHRMPLMLSGAGREDWLAGGIEQALAAIEPFPADEMLARRIGRAINDPSRDAAEVAEPLD